MNRFVRSPLNYIGNKFKNLEDIMPKMEISKDWTFVDVFGGSGLVGVNSNANRVIYNELDKNVYLLVQKMYKFSFQKFDDEVTKITKYYNLNSANEALKKEGFNNLKKAFNSDKDSFKFFTLILYGFNSQIRYNKKGDFNIPLGKSGYTEYRKENLKLFMIAIKRKNLFLKI